MSFPTPLEKNYKHTDVEQQIARHRKVAPVALGQSSATGPSAPVKTTSATSGLDPYTGPWEEAQVTHLLKRTLFGFRKADLEYFKGLTPAAAIEQIVRSSPLPDPPVNDYNDPENDKVDPVVPEGETWVNSGRLPDFEGERIVSLKTWIIKNIIAQENTIYEKMVFFWHNLLVTKVWDVFISKISYQYFKLLQENCLGNFRELMKKITLDPAMLVFLNGTYNRKEAPDENYARELQELFCIGKGPDAGYTESDVQAAARVLTGWVVGGDEVGRSGPVNSYFIPDYHDTSDKQFSAFYGNRVIEGKAGTGGADELDELLDMIFDQTETARYLVRRLYTFFVYSEISAFAEQNIIRPLADEFKANGFEVLPVLKKLLGSEHFFDALHQGALIKSPIDQMIGTWKSLETPFQDPADLHNQKIQNSRLLWLMAGLGMEMGDPPTVAGWAPYYQAPQFDKYWITTITITKRGKFVDDMLHWGVWLAPGLRATADLIYFVAQLNQPDDPVKLLQESSRLLLGLELNTDQLTAVKDILLSGQATDGYWTQAWNDYQDNPTEEYRLVLENRLKPTFQYMLHLAEAQLI